MKKAVVLFSGGQDSTTCLFLAKKEFDIIAIGFDYGQRHKKELECARQIAYNGKVEYQVLSVPIINQLSPNALTRQDILPDKYDDIKSNDGGHCVNSLPNTLVEGRNLFFISFAAVYAKTRGIKDIFVGVSQTDYSGYPDCRLEFVKSLEHTLNLSMEYDFVIHTPLMHLDKAQTWALADQLGVLSVVKNKTLTCYNGIIGEGCGECPACVLRKKGYDKFVKDRKP